MRTADGRVITAVAKEKETARKEHEEAIRAERMTGLVEHVSDDGTFQFRRICAEPDLVRSQYSQSLWDAYRSSR